MARAPTGQRTPERRAEALKALDERLDALWDAENRLAVRLGLEHWVFQPFTVGVIQYQKARQLLAAAGDGGSDTDEVTRLAKLAVQLQHEFWRRAALHIGPGDPKALAIDRPRDRAADRERNLRRLIEDTLDELNESGRLPRSATESTHAAETRRQTQGAN